jgi:hypothetical protein
LDLPFSVEDRFDEFLDDAFEADFEDVGDSFLATVRPTFLNLASGALLFCELAVNADVDALSGPVLLDSDAAESLASWLVVVDMIVVDEQAKFVVVRWILSAFKKKLELKKFRIRIKKNIELPSVAGFNKTGYFDNSSLPIFGLLLDADMFKRISDQFGLSLSFKNEKSLFHF